MRKWCVFIVVRNPVFSFWIRTFLEGILSAPIDDPMDVDSAPAKPIGPPICDTIGPDQVLSSHPTILYLIRINSD
jgi:hypothetical protein